MPRALSVVQKMRFFASSLPYFFSMISRNTRNAIAGSVVVPDFEIMLIEMSRPSQICTSSASAEEEMLLPVK